MVTFSEVPTSGGPTMLGVVVSVLVVVCKRMQHVKSNTERWELLANNVASVCRGL